MVSLNIQLPQGFLNEETLCDYTVSEEMKKVWAVELDLLNQLQKLCEKYNINYCASAGTLLGAIRHKGFIPWDDDIDVVMIRDDYERFCNLADEFETPYELQFYEKTKGYFTGHAQLRNTMTTGVLKSSIENRDLPEYNQGIFIDIFPLDSVPDDEKIREKHLKKIEKYKKLAARSYNCTIGYNKTAASIKRKVARIAFRLLPKKYSYEYFYMQFTDLCKKYNNEQTKYVSMLSFQPENASFWIERKYLQSFQESKFEMLEIRIPTEYDEVLKYQYGNYMKFVKNGSYHGGIIFDVDTPFEDWKKQNL